MLTKEQWEDAARFMGLTFIDMMADGVPIVRQRGNGNMTWMPHEDWRDFGPLLILLIRWHAKAAQRQREAFEMLSDKLHYAIEDGTDQEIMQAGLLLAAAIGKTMREGT